MKLAQKDRASHLEIFPFQMQHRDLRRNVNKAEHPGNALGNDGGNGCPGGPQAEHHNEHQIQHNIQKRT